jgi:hypothetical protein
MFSSPIGEGWKRRPPPLAETPVITGLRAFPDRIVALGGSGLIAYASRIEHWRAARTDCLQTIYDVARGPRLFVAVGDRGTLLLSRNGHDWILRNPGTAAALTGVAHGHDLFVVIGNDGIWTYRPGKEATGTPEERLAADIALRIAQLADKRKEVREQARRKLIIIGAPALKDLQAVLNDKDIPASARGEAIDIIAHIGGTPAATALTNVLERTETSLRIAAARGLFRLAEPTTFPSIRSTLTESNLPADLTVVLIETLGRIGDTRSARLLIPILEDDTNTVSRTAAAAALDTIIGKSHGEDQRSRMRWIRRQRPEWLEATPQELKGPTYRGLSSLIVGGALLGFAMTLVMLRG